MHSNKNNNFMVLRAAYIFHFNVECFTGNFHWNIRWKHYEINSHDRLTSIIHMMTNSLPLHNWNHKKKLKKFAEVWMKQFKSWNHSQFTIKRIQILHMVAHERHIDSNAKAKTWRSRRTKDMKAKIKKVSCSVTKWSPIGVYRFQ